MQIYKIKTCKDHKKPINFIDNIYSHIDPIYSKKKVVGRSPTGARARSARPTAKPGNPTKNPSQTGAHGADHPTKAGALKQTAGQKPHNNKPTPGTKSPTRASARGAWAQK